MASSLVTVADASTLEQLREVGLVDGQRLGLGAEEGTLRRCFAATGFRSVFAQILLYRASRIRVAQAVRVLIEANLELQELEAAFSAGTSMAHEEVLLLIPT